MLAVIAATPATLHDAVSGELLDQCAVLARVHSDGWGTAWAGSDGSLSGSRSNNAPASAGEIAAAGAETASARLVYLRFASAESGHHIADVQPFLRGSVAFCHNGALSPREDVLALLSPVERRELTSTTDSEAYFALVKRMLETGAGTPAENVASAVRLLRQSFPEACLNAFVLHAGELFVVQSRGAAPTPIAAFERRGFTLDTLPPGHDGSYNQISFRTAAGKTIVSTTGVDQAGWHPLAEDTVTHFRAGWHTTIRLSGAPSEQ